MRYFVEVPEVTLFEVFDAATYYDLKQQGLGDDLYNDFENILLQIEKNPLLFQKTHRTYRHALLGKFPYLIIFRIFGNRVLVNKFIHAHKDPVKRYK